MIASDDNRTDQARQALEKVLQLDPKSLTALRQLGELELRAGDYARAAEHLKQAREGGDANAAFYEGQAREKIGDFAGARDALEASLKLTPGQSPPGYCWARFTSVSKIRKTRKTSLKPHYCCSLKARKHRRA